MPATFPEEGAKVASLVNTTTSNEGAQAIRKVWEEQVVKTRTTVPLAAQIHEYKNVSRVYGRQALSII
jgi:hypothetical protein